MTESTIKLEENAKEIISHFQFVSVGYISCSILQDQRQVSYIYYSLVTPNGTAYNLTICISNF
jgi:hypothetical protein